MDLKEFIVITLSSIYSGVTETNKKLWGDELGKTKSSSFVITPHDKESLIEFDVALTVESESSRKGSGGLKVYVAELGGGKESANSEQKISKIKFKVKAHQFIG
jgi:hypothetical protein